MNEEYHFFWKGEDEAKKTDPKDCKGENLLGKALDKVKEILIKEI